MEYVLEWAEKVGEGLDDLPSEERRDMLQILLDRVMIDRDNNVVITLGIPTDDYHRGTGADTQSLAARILAAADTYQTKTERRPHRGALTPEAAADALQAEVHSGRLDGQAVSAVLSSAGHRTRTTRRRWPAGLSDREVEVIRLIASGLTNGEMAKHLVISAKTVGHHVQHVYDKIGVSTRAAATLFAMQHDLIGDTEPPSEE